MNAMTPAENTDRSILEILADKELFEARAAELLEKTKAAEAAEAKANEARAAAQIVLDSNLAALAKERELQAINTAKSAKLTEEKAALADKLASHEINKADDQKRLAEWEQRLKAQHDAQAEVQAELDRKVNALVVERAKFEADVKVAEQTIARAQRIKDAMES